MTAGFCPHCMQPTGPGDVCCPRCGRGLDVQAAPHHLPIGTVLRTSKGHTFLFGKVLGEGGFGLTYIGKELSSGRLVAIKEYFPARCQPQRGADLSLTPTAWMEQTYQRGMRSFISEATMLRAVQDIPSIVHVLEFFEANSTAYMVMDYLNGTTLKDLMQTQTRLEPESLLKKVLALSRDLEKLHNTGVLHRDIAPDNIMLMPDGSLVLLDFGCARSMEDGKAMTVVLKPGFAPIEQHSPSGQGPYTDVYALCATVYYCLTGKVPVPAIERVPALYDGKPDPLLPPTALGAALTPAQERVLMEGLSIQGKDRPQTMGDLADRLDWVLPDMRTIWKMPPAGWKMGEETPDPPKPPKPPFWETYSRQLLIGAAAVIALLLLALVFK